MSDTAESREDEQRQNDRAREEEERRQAQERDDEERRAENARDSDRRPDIPEPRGVPSVPEMRDVHQSYDIGSFLKTPAEAMKLDGAVVGADGKTYPSDTPADKIPPVEPKDKPPSGVRILYINGIVTDVEGQSKSMQHLADATGASVVGIHNATQGCVKDLGQCIQDKVDQVHNKAVDKLARTVEDMVEKGETVNILAHSQGALDTSRALRHVVRDWKEQGVPEKEIEKRLHDHVYVETIGGAAHTYPAGPNYHHIVNQTDFVPALFGINEQFRNKDAEFFRKETGDSFKNHDFETYLPHIQSSFFHK